MIDYKHAEAMLSVARKDLKALKGMNDSEIFEEEIFGFHVQQCVEKALKAWLALMGVQYQLTHDLRILLAKLQSLGADMAPYRDLVEYNVFAVRLRYDSTGLPDDPIDRVAAVRAAEGLVLHVEQVVQTVAEAE